MDHLSSASMFRNTIDRFVEAFNVNDLNAVMMFFADDAVYKPGDGTEHRGPAAIRRAFEPQFNGAFGTMRFDEHDRLIDDVQRKAAIRWVCRHDLSGAKTFGVSQTLQRLVVSAFVGRQFGWEGLDVFHFDTSGKIVGKYTYANYGRPLLRRDLGVALPKAGYPNPLQT
ncbi:YybH family protein [Nevskia soli]|uniref:YybH family protein n=1 Tax=Nevskia soli TaxID=418856 RepID=UPI001B80A1A3|nr:nuclear transport factor 2 family protein [Nevskia soli]